MEIESTATVRITEKEANNLASKIALGFMREYPLDETRMKQVFRMAERILTDHEFETEVTVDYEPEERDEP